MLISILRRKIKRLKPAQINHKKLKIYKKDHITPNMDKIKSNPYCFNPNKNN